MKASELIEELQKQIDSNGDIEVKFFNEQEGVYLEIEEVSYKKSLLNKNFISIE